MEQTELRPGTRAAVRPATPRQRAARAARNGGEPTLEFAERVPYDAYVQASTLHGLQQPLSSDPGEMSFLMVSQIMELYFGLTCHELRETSRLLRADRVWEALAPLRRAALHLEGLNAAWRGLRWMTPADFNRFRNLLGEGSGFQSAMYRQLEFLLGLRDPALIRPFRRQTEVHTELTDALATPSVWDEVIALLARHGHDLPAELLERDVAAEHETHPAVEAAWVRIYADTGPENQLRLLGEALTEVAEQFGDWRHHHIKAVQRTMGAKVGSGGSAGLAWLQRSMARVVFPELWSARTAM
ncbi:tryptophan 2,3-dioxygenase [Micromonospora phaseoli]|uniref:Tryptophan 2,3-dioxygenase n=1 Tax=Micromonospora phaseoli TaxID=1144548 RepID=A0A1H7E405_9ACTN|nr:tryptophan 2,3-dioxygenase family protein [Micromonospora phaseoli]PZV89220.1 tryptophan 2,3-dioxygenase [Micromonospora phaseoli]GIJ80533.1 tryptophan 2,3-dioxygenase [Micromonospora phaseoli]SEK05325.1 tryptophan 2,3-dioxygenase [Micromonospora phaseoli]